MILTILCLSKMKSETLLPQKVVDSNSTIANWINFENRTRAFKFTHILSQAEFEFWQGDLSLNHLTCIYQMRKSIHV
jgi:hypothetical protein